MRREQHQQILRIAARTIRQKIDKYSVLKAIAPNADGVDVLLETQAEMVAATMVQSNLSRQQKCIGTPSMSPSFIADFGYLSKKPAALSIIAGTYLPPFGTDPYLVEFLECLQMPEAIQALCPFNFSVDAEKNRSAWMKQRGNTAGETTCLSFSHYKPAPIDPDLNSIDTMLCTAPLVVVFLHLPGKLSLTWKY